MIRTYLQKDAGIKQKKPDEQKRIIQAYIKEVIIYETTMEINTIVTLNGGGEESRTPVRKSNHKGFSECRLLFSGSLLATPTVRLSSQLS